MKLLKRTVAGLGLAALAMFAIVPAASANEGEINAYVVQPIGGDLGDRYVEPGEVTRVVLALRSGSGTVPAQVLNSAWTVTGGATWVNAEISEVNQGGSSTHTYTLPAPTWIEGVRFNGTVNAEGSWTFRNYYANLQIPADAQPGDVYVTRAEIGVASGTGYTNVGSPTVAEVTLTVRAPDVTADTPAEGSTVPVMMPVIEGSGQPGQTVTLTDESGATIGTGTVGSDGRWAVQTSQLAPGPHTVTVTQTDSSGYTSTDDISFIVAEDAEVPVIDPLVAGGVGVALLAGAGVFLLAKRRRSLAG